MIGQVSSLATRREATPRQQVRAGNPGRPPSIPPISPLTVRLAVQASRVPLGVAPHAGTGVTALGVPTLLGAWVAQALVNVCGKGGGRSKGQSVNEGALQDVATALVRPPPHSSPLKALLRLRCSLQLHRSLISHSRKHRSGFFVGVEFGHSWLRVESPL